jgi:hypothetical protein
VAVPDGALPDLEASSGAPAALPRSTGPRHPVEAANGLNPYARNGHPGQGQTQCTYVRADERRWRGRARMRVVLWIRVPFGALTIEMPEIALERSTGSIKAWEIQSDH